MIRARSFGLDPAPVSATVTSTIAVDQPQPEMVSRPPCGHRVARIADQVAENDPELIGVAQGIGEAPGGIRW